MNVRTSFGNAFSDRTFQHAMLYIPEGTWGEAVYVGGWYRFNNIREVAMEAKSLAPSTVYTLMDSKSFGYAVYDPSQQQVKIVKAFYSIDENDPNSCWQVVEAEGGKCLYNLGAKKYVRLNQDGSFTLTNIPFFIGMTDGSNGVKFNNKDDGEWGFVVRCLCLCKGTNFLANHNGSPRRHEESVMFMPMQRY